MSGCTAKTTQAEDGCNEGAYLDQGHVQFESSHSHRYIKVENVDPQRTSNGLLKVTLTLRNLKKQNLWVDIRTTFLDERGHVVEQTNWEPTLLDARTISEYTCTSMGKQVVDYQVVIRRQEKTTLDNK
jgi:hypothetical protein